MNALERALARLVLALCILIGVPSCAGVPVDDAPPPVVEPVTAEATCELQGHTARGRLWYFEHLLWEVNPVPVACVDLGDGWFDCTDTPETCLWGPYTGTCPHCYGGGE